MHVEHQGELDTHSAMGDGNFMQGRQTLILSRISFCYHSSRACN